MKSIECVPCAECGIEFGMPKPYVDSRRENGNSFYCPNGHRLSFGVGENEILRRERDRLNQRIAQRDDEIRALERSNRGLKAAHTRQKRRHMAGVCPCCHRTFKQLAAHMRRKHPGVEIPPPEAVAL